ncbi:MAG: hypothetical protein RIC80_02220 [Cyclobacteriaceae bacterium]
MDKKKECPSCAMEVDADSTTCPICAYEFPKSNWGLQLVAVGLLIVILLYWIL